MVSKYDENGFCKECGSKPCRCKEMKKARSIGSRKCDACDCELGLRGGYGGTDLCGPCCTGEAETLEEKYIEW